MSKVKYVIAGRQGNDVVFEFDLRIHEGRQIGDSTQAKDGDVIVTCNGIDLVGIRHSDYKEERKGFRPKLSDDQIRRLGGSELVFDRDGRLALAN